MSTRRLTLVLINAAIVAAFASCGTPRRSEPVAGQFVPASARIEHGRTLYNAHCHHCHPGGEGGLGPSLNNKPLPRFLLRFQARHGLGVMPAFDERTLSDEEIGAIADYLIALRNHK